MECIYCITRITFSGADYDGVNDRSRLLVLRLELCTIVVNYNMSVSYYDQTPKSLRRALGDDSGACHCMSSLSPQNLQDDRMESCAPSVAHGTMRSSQSFSFSILTLFVLRAQSSTRVMKSVLREQTLSILRSP